MAMKVSAQGINLITNAEGFVGHAYKPVAAERFYTIGFGHYGPDVRPGQKITRSAAEKLLDRDLDPFERVVNRAITAPLTQPQFDACVSLAYNIGVGAFASSTVVKRANQRDYKGAAKAFLMWVNGASGYLAGLAKRRRAESNLFLRAVVKPVQFSANERYHMHLAKAKGVSARRRVRNIDWIRHQAALIQKAARGERGGWEKHDRARRFAALRKLLPKK